MEKQKRSEEERERVGPHQRAREEGREINGGSMEVRNSRVTFGSPSDERCKIRTMKSLDRRSC